MSKVLPPIPALPFILITYVFTGCGSPVQPPKPAPESFVDYYAGELVAREMARLQNEPQTVLDSRLDSLRNLYGLSRAQTDSLLEEVRSTITGWEAFLNDVLERIERREDTLNAQGPGGTGTDADGVQ